LRVVPVATGTADRADVVAAAPQAAADAVVDVLAVDRRERECADRIDRFERVSKEDGEQEMVEARIVLGAVVAEGDAAG
jgi:hypothetical protein